MKTKLLVPCIVAAFLICLATFFDVELSPGVSSDGTDWAMYVMHARNIVGGRPYTQTGYIYQPECAELGSNAYPAGYPLILAPLYAAGGLNIKLFKMVNAAFLVLSLWPAYLFARRTLPPVSSLVLVAALGCSWLFLANSDMIGSDAPYQLVSLLVLLLVLRIYDRRLNETNPWTWGLLTGLTITAAYLIRPFGVALLLALGGIELLRYRRPTAFAWAVAAGFVPLMLLNNFLFHSDGGYSNQFTFSLTKIVHHFLDYAGFFSYAFANPVSNLYRYLLWGAALIPVLLGVAKRVKAGVTITELYVLTLLAVDTVYWATNPRYLLPVMPIYLVYMFEGFQVIAQRFPQPFVLPLKATAAALLLFAPAANAFLVRPNPRDTLVTTPAYEDLCATVRRQTAPNSFLIFWNPRVFALSTQRSSSSWPAQGQPQEMMRYLRRVRPDYIIADKNRAGDRRFLLPLLGGDSPLPITKIYENQQFLLVRLLPDNDKKGLQ